MLLRSQSKRETHDEVQETMEETKNRLVNDVFGREEDINAAFPPIEKVIALIWLYREEENVLQYLCQMIENHAMKQPRFVDTIEVYLPQLIQLSLKWDGDKDSENRVERLLQDSKNRVERLLLVLAQLSTRFAVQYHWHLQNLLADLQLECTIKNPASGRRRPNPNFDMEYYARCMLLAGDLERCMSGKRRKEAVMPTVDTLAITTSYGGKVTNDEVQYMKEEETSQGFFDAIVAVADDNVGSALAAGGTESVVALEVPLKRTFGGVLYLKPVHRKGPRRKQWKERYFAIEESCLNCYSRERELLLSMSLQGASVWKGLQADKYPHSFVVTSNSSMYHLRANSEEQKAVWKHMLREAITASQPPPDQPDSLLERHRKYEDAKSFARTLTEITNGLDHAPSEERSQVFQESLFELDMPKEMCWPWSEHDGSAEKSVFVALPHFSHLLSHNHNLKPLWGELPRFQASFMVKRDERAIQVSSYESFLLEGRPNVTGDQLPMPEELLEILQSNNDGGGSLKHPLETGSTTGSSTEEPSVDEESNISGYNSTMTDSEEEEESTSKPSSSSRQSESKVSSSFSREEGDYTSNSSESRSYESTSDDSEDSSSIPTTIPMNKHTVSDLTLARSVLSCTDTALLNASSSEDSEEESYTNSADDKSTACTGHDKSTACTGPSPALYSDPNLSVEMVLAGTPILRTSHHGKDKESTSKDNQGKESSAEEGPTEDFELVLTGAPSPAEEDGKSKNEEADREAQGKEFNSDGSSSKEYQPNGTMMTAAARRTAFASSNTRSSFFDSDSESLGPTAAPVGNQGNGSSSKKALASLRTKLHQPKEMLAAQLGQYYESFYQNSMIWIRAPRLRRTSRDMTIVEVPRHAVRIADAKESLEAGGSLMDYFFMTFGSPESESFQAAQTCFAQSLAGLFLLSYLLGVKDRREEHLMLDKEGHVFAADYSSVFESESSSSSKAAPFKLTKEYMEVLGGPSSSCFQIFRCLLVSGLKRARQDAATVLGLLHLVPGNSNGKHRERVVQFLRQKLMLHASEEAAEKKMHSVLRHSQRPSFLSSLPKRGRLSTVAEC